MALGWLPSTSQGPMVGDYISTSFVTGNAQPVYAVALAPSGTTLNEAMNAQQLSASGGSVATTNTAAPTGGNIPPIAADRAAKDRVTKRR
jgi:hypothetical protein